MKRWLARVTVLIGLIAPLPAAAELDALAFELHEGQSPGVRWDNLEGKPYVRGDVPVRFDATNGRHILRLDAGEAATLALPAHADLMLADTGNGEDLEALRVWRSTDGAAWRRLTANARGDERRRYRAPASGAYRVRLKAPPDQAINLAAFRSRRVEVPEHPLYRRLVMPDADARLRIGGDSRRFRRLGAGEAMTLRVEGPTRLALEHRRLGHGPRARLSAPYSLTLTRGGERERVVAGGTRPQRAAVARLDGRPVAVSMREMAYWQIPDGKQTLRIEADAPVLLRVRARYTDDTLAGRPANWNAAPGTFHEGLFGSSSAADRNPAALARALAERLRLPATQEGGLAAAARLQARAEPSPFPREVTTAARTLAGATSFWRELEPGGRIRASLTAYPEAAALQEPLPLDPRPPVMISDEIVSLAASHQARSFHQVGGKGPDELVYPVPERGAPSRLRLSIVRGDWQAPAELALRIGATTHRVRITPRRSGQRQPEPDLAALRLLWAGADGDGEAFSRQGSDRARAGTLSAPFSAVAPSAPMVATARLELALPPGVDQIAVVHASGPAVRLSPAYRAAKGLELGETGHRRAVAKMGGRPAALTAFMERLKAMTADAAPPEPSTPAGERLAAHHTALVDLLAARYAAYASGIERRGHRFRAPDGARDAPAAARLARQARALEQAGHWGAAAKLWGEAANRASGDAWRRTELARIDALEQAGAEGLAERLLRGFHRYSDDAGLRQAAFERLRERLGGRESNALLIGAHVAEALRRDDASALAPLVALLLEGGNGRRARDLAALLGPSRVPAAARVHAFHAGDWPAHREAALEDLAPAERGRWRSLIGLGPAEPSVTRRSRADRDPQQAPWARAMREGRSVARRLRDPSSELPYADWLAWESQHPGGRAWHGADHLVETAAARPTLRALRRETLVTPALATPDEPVELVAPAGRLRLTLRLRLAPDEREQAGWARVRVNGDERVIPVNATGPTTGLAPLTGDYGVGPGRHAVIKLAGTTGRVTIDVDRPMLVGVERAVPSPRLPLLPEPRPAVMASMANEQPGRNARCRGRVRVAQPRPDRVRRVCANARGLTQAPAAPLNRADLAIAGDPDEAQRLAAALAPCAPPYNDCADVARRIYTADRLGDEPEAVADLLTQVGPFFGFERVEQVINSAGVRTVAVQGWQPHSPQLRARRPFLGDMAPGAEVLSGPGSLYVDFVNRSPTTLLLDLRTVDMPTYPDEPATLRYRLDSGQWRRAEVTPQGRRLAIDVGAGRHAIELKIQDPTQERYLVVTPRERRGGRGRALAEPVERSYELATRAEPAVFAVDSGVLVRVDRYRDGTITSEHRRLDDGEDTVRVTPDKGERRALVRVYELRHRGDGPTSAARYHPEPAPEPRGPPMTAGALEAVPAVVGERGLHDQEDGTTTVGVGWQRRRQAEDEPDQGGDRDGFVAARLEHRYWDPVSERYYQGGLLVRSRSDGRPTFGAAGEVAFPDRVLGDADWLPLDMTLDLSGFVQDTDAEGAQASVTARAAARHQRRVGERTMVSLRVDGFARHLTLDEGLAGDEMADADVFTRYKEDHPVGWGIGGGLTHAPYLDTRLYGQLSVRSNPQLVDADNLAGEVGARQFVDGLRIDAAYRETRFFADDDRAEATSTRRLDLDVAYELWQGDGDRLELTAGVRQDLRRSDTSLGIALDWHFGGGQRVGPVGLGNARLLRDFRPGATGFRSLREARYPGWRGEAP